LIVATETSAESPLLSLRDPHETTMEAFGKFHHRLQDAASISKAGGVLSGVKCAGQLATFLDGGKQDAT
jgi:hypothetical protein